MSPPLSLIRTVVGSSGCKTCHRRRLPTCYSRLTADWIEVTIVDRDRFGSCRSPPPCTLFRFDRIGVALHRPGSAKSSASARRFSFGLEPRGHAEPPELPYAERRVLKNHQELCFLSCSARWFSSGLEP
jgi:hypothetical protein